MDGKSIMGILLLAAAARIDDHHFSADGSDERRCRRRAGRAGRSRGDCGEESHAAPERDRRVARRRVGPRRHADPARAGAALPDCAGCASSTSCGGSTRAARDRAQQLVDIQRPRRAAAAGAGVAVRRAAADARRSDARCRAPPTSSASSASTPSGRSSRCSTSSARCSTKSPIRILRERTGRRRRSGRPPADEPAPGRRDAARSAARARRSRRC